MFIRSSRTPSPIPRQKAREISFYGPWGAVSTHRALRRDADGVEHYARGLGVDYSRRGDSYSYKSAELEDKEMLAVHFSKK